MEAAFGFIAGIIAGIILWFPFVFAPVAAFGDIDAEMPGWAIAASIWWYFACGLVGAFIAHRHL